MICMKNEAHLTKKKAHKLFSSFSKSKVFLFFFKLSLITAMEQRIAFNMNNLVQNLLPPKLYCSVIYIATCRNMQLKTS